MTEEIKHFCSSILSVVHRLHLSLEDGQEVAAIFYDLKKAFDSVPHLPLLAKLSSFGIHPSIVSWVTSYLTSRSQQVVLNGVTSLEVYLDTTVEPLYNGHHWDQNFWPL